MEITRKHLKAMDEAIDSLAYWQYRGDETIKDSELRMLEDIYLILKQMKGGERKMEIEEYRKAYEEIFSKVGDKDVALALLNHVAKDRRTVVINDKKGGNGSSNGNGHSNGFFQTDEPATPKQIGYLKVNNIQFKDGITKDEASRLIDEAKRK